jgi:hypothetical protein
LVCGRANILILRGNVKVSSVGFQMILTFYLDFRRGITYLLIIR